MKGVVMNIGVGFAFTVGLILGWLLHAAGLFA